MRAMLDARITSRVEIRNPASQRAPSQLLRLAMPCTPPPTQPVRARSRGACANAMRVRASLRSQLEQICLGSALESVRGHDVSLSLAQRHAADARERSAKYTCLSARSRTRGIGQARVDVSLLSAGTLARRRPARGVRMGRRAGCAGDQVCQSSALSSIASTSAAAIGLKRDAGTRSTPRSMRAAMP